MEGLKWELKGTLGWIVGCMKFIDVTERQADKQIDNIMAGSLRPVWDPAPKTNSVLGVLKRRTRTYVVEVVSILRPF